MYRFYRKINANGRMNTDFFTEGNEGGGHPVLITQQGHKERKDRILTLAKRDSLRLGLIAFTNRQPLWPLRPCCENKSGVATTFVAFVDVCKNP
jgi:hypothetical protein